MNEGKSCADDAWPDTPWVVFLHKPEVGLECKMCGVKCLFELPMSISDYCTVCYTFCAKHVTCQNRLPECRKRSDIMNVKELKEKLALVPDDYQVYSQSSNSACGLNINWARGIAEVRELPDDDAVMLIGGWE